MSNRLDALEYHRLTKHSVASVQSNRHYLDWDNQPLPFKIYSGLEPIPLPRDFDRPERGDTVPDLRSLAYLLQYTGGITRKRVYASGQEYYFRAAACTGALYHIDLYVVCDDLGGGVEAGVYHFGPHDFALRRLRRGDHRRVVVEASGQEPALARAPVIVVCTSTFWRNAWKYQSRTYRHCFWDDGTMLANLLAVAGAAEIPARIVVGFADAPVNELLGLDPEREVALSCVALGRSDSPAPAPPALSPIDYATLPLSRHEVDYPMIRAAHAGSSLDTPDDARRWRLGAFERRLAEPNGALIPLAESAEAPMSIEGAITRRGSARQFAREAISYDALSSALRAAVAAVPADFLVDVPAGPNRSTLLNDVYLIVNAVDGLAPGAYVYRPDRGGLEVLKSGEFRRQAGHLDLGQELAADAAANFYLLSNLGEVAAYLGNRGYRAAALEAAVAGGRIYLEAYRRGLGATGLTFFDDDVTEFFSPHAAGKSVMFLTAIGRPARRPVR
jgi:SagB-type dehydrogenase family enzyme